MNRRAFLQGAAIFGTFTTVVGIEIFDLSGMAAKLSFLKGRRIGPISWYLGPGYSQCQRCKTTWAFVEPHAVDYALCSDNDDSFVEPDGKMGGSGIFFLCEQCWNECSVNERVHYARVIFDKSVWEYHHLGKNFGWPFKNEAKAWIGIERSVRLDWQWLASSSEQKAKLRDMCREA